MQKGISNLEKLINSMKPHLRKEEYVFCTLPRNDVLNGKLKAIMQFKEEEGTTIVIEKKVAEINGIKYNSIWSLISLSVHSDLEAVGFLASVTKKLAQGNISVNAVSAYYHDHLFVPKDKAKQAMQLLKAMQISSG